MGLKWSIDRRRYLDAAEVKILLKTLNRETKRGLKERNYKLVRDWFMIELGLYSGLRVSEMTALKNSDFITYSTCSFIHVRKGKGKKRRLVRVGTELIKAYQEFTRFKKRLGMSTDGNTAILCKKNATALSARSLQLAFKRCAKKAGLDSHYSIHCLRHTYGSHLYRASKYNLRFVQEQLGHSSTQVTEVYANVMIVDADKALSTLYK